MSSSKALKLEPVSAPHGSMHKIRAQKRDCLGLLLQELKKDRSFFPPSFENLFPSHSGKGFVRGTHP